MEKLAWPGRKFSLRPSYKKILRDNQMQKTAKGSYGCWCRTTAAKSGHISTIMFLLLSCTCLSLALLLQIVRTRINKIIDFFYIKKALQKHTYLLSFRLPFQIIALLVQWFTAACRRSLVSQCLHSSTHTWSSFFSKPSSLFLSSVSSIPFHGTAHVLTGSSFRCLPCVGLATDRPGDHNPVHR